MWLGARFLALYFNFVGADFKFNVPHSLQQLQKSHMSHATIQNTRDVKIVRRRSYNSCSCFVTFNFSQH